MDLKYPTLKEDNQLQKSLEKKYSKMPVTDLIEILQIKNKHNLAVYALELEIYKELQSLPEEFFDVLSIE
jgi:hypothetical protein